MAATFSVTVTVPATTANIGPGFDCLGAALSLYNQFRFQPLADEAAVAIHVSGPEAKRVVTDGSNLVYQAYARLFQHIQRPAPAVAIDIQLGVPLARGLGSSSTAIVGGLLGANAIANFPLTQREVLNLAIAMEGHPDNVAPALLGGCQLAASGDDWAVVPVAWHADIVPVVAIPNFELSTEAARSVLPEHYSRADAIFNAAHLGLLLRGLETGNGVWLRRALCDRIHQPYRQHLIPGYPEMTTAALAVGAYGLVISGAGPTLLALAPTARVSAVKEAMEVSWPGSTAVAAHALTIDVQGAQTLEHST